MYGPWGEEASNTVTMENDGQPFYFMYGIETEGGVVDIGALFECGSERGFPMYLYEMYEGYYFY